ncbi:MAG: ATP:cob(I)alamin adenosyltransferase [Gammaproteobacteria bacterium]|nr:MAG: ATP:cob(I)alamin adenosyltransferase [Gammaproteobacteria bacterium]
MPRPYAAAVNDRLTRITTGRGDDGFTQLADGRRVSKTDARVVALGELDELNCQLGVLLAHRLPEALREALLAVQQDLFDLGAAVAGGRTGLREGRSEALAAATAELAETLGPLREFVLPGGGAAAAACHLARAVCRRAERAVVALGEAAPAAGRVYLNRLSDWLFQCARWLAAEQPQPWRGPDRAP